MGQVLVRNLDDQVIESLKTKAELKGHSLEQELREVITAAAPLTPERKSRLRIGCARWWDRCPTSMCVRDPRRS